MRGENLTLADGTVIKPSDVMSPTIPGMVRRLTAALLARPLIFPFQVMLVVTCPTVEYLDYLVDHQDWTQYYSGHKCGQLTACIIHMTPHNVLQDSRYKHWMKRFDEHVQVSLSG